MAKYENILQAIGRTPLIRLRRIGADIASPIYAKVESLNPGGSVKDRVGFAMVEAAEKAGLLKPGGTLATFCCSHHVDSGTFQDVILSAAYDTRHVLRRVAT